MTSPCPHAGTCTAKAAGSPQGVPGLRIQAYVATHFPDGMLLLPVAGYMERPIGAEPMRILHLECNFSGV